MNKDKFIKLFNICFYGFVSLCCVVMFVCCVYYLVYAERYKDHLRDCPNCPDLPIVQSVALQPADTVVNGVYTSGHFAVPISFFNSSTFPNNFSYTDYYDIQITLSSNSLDVIGFKQNVSSGSFGNIYVFEHINTNFTTGSWIRAAVRSSIVNNSTGTETNDLYTFLSYRVDNGFNYDVYKVSFLTESGFGGNHSYVSEKIVLTDSNDNTFALSFPARFESNYINTDYLFIGNSTYFISNSLSDEQSYNAGLEAGREQGLSDNQQDIYNAGFDAGEAQGDSNGYQRGLRDANQFTLLNLTGAVVDAPIQAAMGLLNFNFLGFNLWNLATGILSFAAVVKIVKLVLGGR